jgi:hypothetical protein
VERVVMKLVSGTFLVKKEANMNKKQNKQKANTQQQAMEKKLQERDKKKRRTQFGAIKCRNS